MRFFKKSIWILSGFIAKYRFPIRKNINIVGLTGTDGKTTTGHFLYEIAKSFGYTPILISTTGVKFKDKYQEIEYQTSSLFVFKIKKLFFYLRKFQFFEAIKLLLSNNLDLSENIDFHRTTPIASDIRKIIKKYTEIEKSDFVILEVTSHALDQYRIFGIYFDSVGYTNITNEHLDYHGTWEKYATAKYKLTRHLKKHGYISLNKDDEKSFTFLSERIKRNIIKYTKNGHIFSKNLFKVRGGSQNTIYAFPHDDNSVKSYELSIPGNYNISNALCAISIFIGFLIKNNSSESINKFLKKYNDKFISGVKSTSFIPGRIQQIHKSPNIFIDFAHTGNGIKAILETFANSTQGRLIVVFGSAGERDPLNRYEKGVHAGKLADIILLCPEDPRSEYVKNINKEILKGIKSSKIEFKIVKPRELVENVNIDSNIKYIVNFDKQKVSERKKAIVLACKIASITDTVLILGKGPERTLSFGGVEFPWSDEEVARKAIQDINSF